MIKSISCILVEDEPVCQYITKIYLEELSVVADIAKNAKEAYSLLEKKKYDIAFVDLGLTDESGIKVTEKIRKTFNLSIPIVVITGHVLKRDEKACLKAGVNKVLFKPVSKNVLKEAVESLLKASQKNFLVIIFFLKV